MQRSGLPLLALAAFVLAAAVGVVFLWFGPITDGLFSRGEVGEIGQADASDEPGADVQPESQPRAPAPEAVTEGEDSPGTQEKTDGQPFAGTGETAFAGATHTVQRRDTLFDLAGSYWSDPYLWPVLFQANDSRVEDPDLLRPGSTLDVPGTPRDLRMILDAHVAAYARYRTIGDALLAAGIQRNDALRIQLGRFKINKAFWVLYSGLRYDEDLIDKAVSVPEQDREVVRGFIERFGPRPGSR